MKKPNKRKIKIEDSLILNSRLLIVKELFIADGTRWVRAEDKREDNFYFSESEWIILCKSNNK